MLATHCGGAGPDAVDVRLDLQRVADVRMHAGYAYEIQTSLGGWGMELLLGGRQYALNGVLNGIDYAEWDPATDANLPANYSIADLPDLKGKAACKRAMQVRSSRPPRCCAAALCAASVHRMLWLPCTPCSLFALVGMHLIGEQAPLECMAPITAMPPQHTPAPPC